MKNVKLDCRHFTGDKPCSFHKLTKVKCNSCNHYSAVDKKILIVKLGAPGDVLRTTPVLREIKHREPSVHITWITHKASRSLLENNPFIDRLWDYSVDVIARLHVEEFDLVLGLDNSGDCASIASLAKGKEKRGYGLNEKGAVVPFNKEAEAWLEMAAFDDVKKANTMTYQDIIFMICGYVFDPSIHEVVLNLKEDEQLFSARFAQKNSLRDSDLVVGVNIGSGSRWPMKRWKIEGFIELIEKLVKEEQVKVVLLGGPDEVEIAGKIKKILATKSIDIIDGGCANPLRDFIAIVDICDVVVTGDTLAMHVAVGLKKNVVAFFGPTSAAEIELYCRGGKIMADKECVCCYRQECEIRPYCVETITVNEVLDAIRKCHNNNFLIETDKHHAFI